MMKMRDVDTGEIAHRFRAPMYELIEVYTHRLKQPAAAVPLLARLASRHPQTPAADWVKRELALVRAEVHGDAADPSTDPAP